MWPEVIAVVAKRPRNQIELYTINRASQYQTIYPCSVVPIVPWLTHTETKRGKRTLWGGREPRSQPQLQGEQCVLGVDSWRLININMKTTE